jgi:formamidopyrimidine-DNA glycosylase
MQTTSGTLRLTDPRRFGAVVWSSALDAPPASTLLSRLGLEPFDERFTGAYLHEALRRRRVSIKQALLAGDVVVGAGNIYACEALFRAGIDPRLPAERLSRPRCAKLAQAVRKVLAAALRHIYAHLRGETLDKESGLAHLAHAGCAVMMGAWLYRHPEAQKEDDRFER